MQQHVLPTASAKFGQAPKTHWVRAMRWRLRWMDLADVALHQHFMGGGFGRRSQHDASIQAARIARDTGVPVKLIWSRAEDTQHDFYRPSVASQFRAALDSDGQVLAWDNIYHEKHEPAEAPLIPYNVSPA